MEPREAGTIIVIILGFVAFCKALTWVVPIKYEVVKTQVIQSAAYMLATNGLGQDEIYTQKGEIRAVVQKKIDSRINELEDMHENEAHYILDYMREKKLINKYGNTCQLQIQRLAYALYKYALYDRKYVYQNLETGILTYGITPEQFLDLKKTIRGDIVGVYIIYNVDKKMYYVGQAKRLYFRVGQHFTGHGNGDVYADYKYGDRFIVRFVTLSESGCSDLDMLERQMIQYYNAFTTGYNKTVGNGAKQTAF